MNHSKIKKEHYSPDENWNSLVIGGATYGWVLTTTYFLKHMKTPEGVQKLQNIPFRLIAGENDNRMYKPYLDGTHDLSRTKKFCDGINQFNKFQNKQLCELKIIKDGFHELHKEKDEIRLQAIESAVEFFLKHSSRKNFQSLNASSL